MSEEEKDVSMPRKIWNTALKTVKGDSTQSLVEDFTAEMTLVAEGLCEDQARLRSQMESLEDSQDRDRQSLRSEIEALETAMREQQRDTDEKLRVLTDRADALERSVNHTGKKGKKSLFGLGWLPQVIILAAIVCGSWVLVTLMQGLFGR